MTTEIQLTLNPNKEKIALYLTFFQLIEREVKIKMTAWEKINKSEHQFLKNLFLSRDVKVELDDVAYIYNYLKFIFKVSKSDFNNENALMDESLKELWPFFQMMERKEKLKRISIQTEDNKTVKFISERSLALFYEIFRYSIKNLSGMKYAKKHLLQLKQQGHLNNFLKQRPGNKIDYTGTVLKLSVTMFKKYLEEETVVDGNKHISKLTIIGKILAHIGFIEIYTDDKDEYLTAPEYYNKMASARDLDIALKKPSKIKDELLPPNFFIELNKDLI